VDVILYQVKGIYYVSFSAIPRNQRNLSHCISPVGKHESIVKNYCNFGSVIPDSPAAETFFRCTSADVTGGAALLTPC
jgi:hypothetical protein